MNSPRLNDILQAINGQSPKPCELPDQFAGISLDTRSLNSNEVFWAIKGSHYDGHDFVESALKAGAAACIVNNTYHPPYQTQKTQLITVKDTLTALQDYAKWHRSRHTTTTIAITGSYGKTTTRELLTSVLSTKSACLQNAGNQNNEIGVPLTVLKLRSHHKFLIAELGATKPGDITPLAQIISPQIGLITGIGPAHLAGFQTKAQIVNTKSDLIAHLPQDGLAFIPGGEEWTRQLAQRAYCPVITFGLSRNNNYHATHFETSNHGLTFQSNGNQYNLPLIGRHHLATALATVAVASELGYRPLEIQKGFDSFQPPAGRGRIIQHHPWTIIDDTYNASPPACEAACKSLADWRTNGRRFLILGDMLELGVDADLYHEQLGRLAGELKIEFVFAYGQFADHVIKGARANQTSETEAVAFNDKRDLIQALQSQLLPTDVILVKGSRGMRMERIVESLASPPKHEPAAASA